MILFWIAFAAFFFALNYGLLQICTEQAILRREHLVGLRLGPYLFSKITVLLPFLAVVIEELGRVEGTPPPRDTGAGVHTS